jgi:hypothetical protein
MRALAKALACRFPDAETLIASLEQAWAKPELASSNAAQGMARPAEFTEAAVTGRLTCQPRLVGLRNIVAS